MAYRVRKHAVKTENLSSVPWIHMVEREPTPTSHPLIYTYSYTLVCTHTLTHYKINKFNF